MRAPGRPHAGKVTSAHYARCQERFDREMGAHPRVQICLYKVDPIDPGAEHTAEAQRRRHREAPSNEHLKERRAAGRAESRI